MHERRADAVHDRRAVHAVVPMCIHQFVQDALGGNDQLRAVGDRFADDAIEGLENVSGIIERSDELLLGDPARIQILSTALGGALVALYLDWADGRLNVSREAISTAAVDVVTALTGFPAGSADRPAG